MSPLRTDGGSAGRGGSGGAGGTGGTAGRGGSGGVGGVGGSAGRGGSGGAGGVGGVGGSAGRGGSGGVGGVGGSAGRGGSGGTGGSAGRDGSADGSGSVDRPADAAADAPADMNMTPDAPPADAPAADPEPGKLAGMTRLHNNLRAMVSVPAMTWDAAMASIAQSYAEQCQFQHSGRSGVGENLAANAPPGNSAAMAFKTWSDEQAFYTYASNTCASGKVCGHYTQLVWRNSTRLGCGVASCTTGSPFSGFPNWEIWVCNYAPPGNVGGEKPY